MIDQIVERQCYVCNCLRGPYVYHCASCKKCVVYMDHHCPWVNNCVGFYNQKLFFLFNMYGLITLGFSGIILCIQFSRDVFDKSQQNELPTLTCIVGCSLFLICLGALFIMTVFCDQVTIILNRMQVLDRVRLESKRIKKNQVKKRGKENYETTFGGKFSYKWFIP